MTPRGYQCEALHAIYEALQHEQNVLLQAIMGAGKTAMTCFLIQRLLNESPGMKMLILAHKKELVEQFKNSFGLFTDIAPNKIGVACAGLSSKKDISRQITIGTVQTFVALLKGYPGAGMIVIDEAHRIDINSKSQYKKTLTALRKKSPNSRLLGLTATPARLGHGYIYGDQCRKGNKNLFERCHHQIKYNRLRDEGYLVPLFGEVANHNDLEADLAGVDVQGDYVLSQLGEIMSKSVHIKTAVQAIQKYCPGYNCVCVFCCTIEHAEAVYSLLSTTGESATVVHSRLSDMEREANMAAWKSGKTRIIVSVNILIEGFDLPRLDCLVMARPTLSSSLFLQAVGRVLRTHDTKKSGMIVDLTDNTSRFGTDLDEIKVYIPKEIEQMKKKEGELNKLCPNCEKEVHKAVRSCPFCGYAWPVDEMVEAGEIPGLTAVAFDGTPDQEPQTETITGMRVSVHQSRHNEKFLGRVDLEYGGDPFRPSSVSVWFCLPDFYSGFAVTKSKKRWVDFSESDFPQTVEDFRNAVLWQPETITIDVNDKYPKIINIQPSRKLSENLPF